MPVAIDSCKLSTRSISLGKIEYRVPNPPVPRRSRKPWRWDLAPAWFYDRRFRNANKRVVRGRQRGTVERWNLASTGTRLFRVEGEREDL